MERAPDRPHSKYPHVYPIVRIDMPIDQSDPTNRITAVKVLTSQGAAEGEVSRLNQINAEKSCTYFYCTSRLIEQGGDTGMTNLPDLHDGFFDGVWLSADKGAHFFVRTATKEPFTIALTGVEALNISGLRAGNIIFDVVFIPPDKLTLKHVEDPYALNIGQGEMSRELLGKAQEQRLYGMKSTLRMGPKGQCSSALSIPSRNTFCHRSRQIGEIRWPLHSSTRIRMNGIRDTGRTLRRR